MGLAISNTSTNNQTYVSTKTMLNETLGDIDDKQRNMSKLANDLEFNRRIYWVNDDLNPLKVAGDPFSIQPRVSAPFLIDPMFLARQSIQPNQVGKPGILRDQVTTNFHPLHFNINNPVSAIGLVNEEMVKLGAIMNFSSKYKQ